MCLYSPFLQSLTLVVLVTCKVGEIQGVQRRKEGGQEVGTLGPPPGRAGSTGTCGFVITATQPDGLRWPVPHDHRPPHPRPAKAGPHPPVLTAPRPPAVTATWPTAGVWEEAQALLGDQRTSPQKGGALSTPMETPPKPFLGPGQLSSAGTPTSGLPRMKISLWHQGPMVLAPRESH